MVSPRSSHPSRPALRTRRLLLATAGIVLVASLASCSSSSSGSSRSAGASASTTTTAPKPTESTPPTTTAAGGFDPNPSNVYAATAPGNLSEAVAGVPTRVYVPNSMSGTVSVIDPATFSVIDTFKTGPTPQHVVPSYDLKTLWVNNNGGSLTEIDPKTAKPVKTFPVSDPYNMYFTPDGSSAIIVAEKRQELDFRDPHTLALQKSVKVDCKGVNHLDYSADGSYFIASCEFGGAIIKFDVATSKVVGKLDLSKPGSMPQDVRLASDGSVFFVADMASGGVYLIDGPSFKETGFVQTGVGAHGLYPSRDGKSFFVINRGSPMASGAPRGPGSISVMDVATRSITANWPISGGGSPDMGNLSADGKQLWLGGRFDNEVYCVDTTDGKLLARIPVGKGPHGLTIWPQPGRFSLGHTGNMR
ncbi:MAG TPA: YncE family protein [Acidimicrobiales bacterium]|nr:YncE family protein [Acidimicrobiales bacterium]